MLDGRCVLIRCVVSPGHDKRKLFCIASMKVDLEGKKKLHIDMLLNHVLFCQLSRLYSENDLLAQGRK